MDFDKKLCSGIGRFHTAREGAANRKPYRSISLREIIVMVRKPWRVRKENGLWVIPHDNLSSSGREKEVLALEDGETRWHFLWGDIDEDAPISEVNNRIQQFDANYIIYSSKSATPRHRKWRIILPLAKPVPCSVFCDLQEALNEFISELSPDSASERCNQILFLPNKGEYYDYEIELNRKDISYGLFAELIAKIKKRNNEKKEEYENNKKEFNEDIQGSYEKASVFGKVEDSIRRIANSRDGEKHSALLKESRLLGGLVHFGYFSQSNITAWLVGAIAARCRSVVSAEKTCRYGIKQGMEHPIRIPTPAKDNTDAVGCVDFSTPCVENVTPCVGNVTESTQIEEKHSFFVKLEDSVKDIKPPDWIIQDTFERGTDCMLVASPSSGKSLLALWWGVCIALGENWQGKRVERGNVIYVCGEGYEGVRRRLKALEIHYGLSFDGAGMYLLPTPINLLGGKYIENLTQEMNELHGGISMIVIDTLHANAAGLEENSNKEMGEVIENIRKIRIRTEGFPATMVVHHTGWAGEHARGASSLNASMDCEYFVKRVQGEDAITLTNTKTKDAMIQPARRFDIKKVPLGMRDKYDTEVSSAVLCGSGKVMDVSDNVNILLSLLESDGRKIIPIPGAKQAFSKAYDGENSRRAFSSALDNAAKLGKLKVSSDKITMLI